MGLAGPKNRVKFSKDPNNTKWTNDTESFGLKIMTSQGWQPGQYLGVKDAAHAEFHTAANASHIRVAIKDDNLGLGAKVGSGVGHGECTGLDAFKNLLGRLNGQDEDELEKEQKSRDDLKRAIYTERKWGSIRFVPGGLLVGDKIQSLIEAEAERLRNLQGVKDKSESDSSSSGSEEEEPRPEEKKSKKRKPEGSERGEPEAATLASTQLKKKRKTEAKPKDDDELAETKEIKKKKSKKDRELKQEAEDTPDETKISRKQEKEAKRDRKREKKEKRVKSRSTSEDESGKEMRKRLKREKKEKAERSDSTESSKLGETTKESTPIAFESSGRSTPVMHGRHAVRSRNIAQKRLASMDAASLNQIFMIKSQT